MRQFSLAILCIVAGAAVAEAGTIERACITSGRSAATPALCGCIQDAANLTLSKSDQKKAAKFFSDPHEAQEVRQSKRASDDAFWDRYQSFGQTAATFCAK